MDFEKGPEGLLYKDDVVGTGPSPTVGDELEVHYAGWYYAPGSTEGVKFDDSRDRDANKGLMFELGIAPIIKGWSLGLETMKQGGKRSLIIPPALGYGDVEVSAAGRPSIPPNSELRFELELVVVNNDIIRKMRRSLNDFLRPQGADFVSPEEKQAIRDGTLKKPLAAVPEAGSRGGARKWRWRVLCLAGPGGVVRASRSGSRKRRRGRLGTPRVD